MTYHHLPSEELWDCTLYTCSFHLVLYVVQQLKLAKAQNGWTQIMFIQSDMTNPSFDKQVKGIHGDQATHHSAQFLYIMLHETV